MAGIYNDSIGGTGLGLGMGGYGYGAGGIFEGLILGALVGRGGFGFDGRRDGHGDGCGCGCCCSKMIDMHDHHNDHDHTVDEIHDVEREVCAAERQMGDYAMMLQKCCCDTDKDVLEAKYALGTQISDAKWANALQSEKIIHDIDIQACGINRNIDEVKFNQAIFAKDAAAQLAACCCTLENKIRDSIDVTKDCCCETQKLMLSIDAKNDMAAAERERRALQREIDELRFDKKFRDSRDEQNVLNNFGTITDSLNKVITALGNTAAA